MQNPQIARIWRGRTRRALADTYQTYILAEGIPKLRVTAEAVQLLREDLEDETIFTVISYWPDEVSMKSFTGGDPMVIRHLPRDSELLVELPAHVEIHKIVLSEQRN